MSRWACRLSHPHRGRPVRRSHRIGALTTPLGWTDEKIIRIIETIANDPASYPGGKLPVPRKATSIFSAVGTVEGVTIRVVVQPAGKGIVTGYPQ
jgi:hypothetical protein